jgi:hypothetical protein
METTLRLGAVAAILAAIFVAPLPVHGQAGAPKTGAKPAPQFQEYRGVRLGMSADEVRAKLGKPGESDDTQDVFSVSDVENVRVYYDGGKKANAIVIAYSGDVSGAPKPEAVLGEAIEPGPDGTLNKMVRFPDEGFWVSYSRIQGDPPSVFVTIKKQ